MNQAIDAPLKAVGQLLESRSDSLLGLGTVGVLAAGGFRRRCTGLAQPAAVSAALPHTTV